MADRKFNFMPTHLNRWNKIYALGIWNGYNSVCYLDTITTVLTFFAFYCSEDSVVEKQSALGLLGFILALRSQSPYGSF